MASSSDEDSFNVDTVEDSTDALFGDSDYASEEQNAYLDDEISEQESQSKYYEVDYITHSVDNLQKTQEEHIDQVSAILGLPTQDAATLLRFFEWNKEKLFERYMEAPDKVRESAGLSSAANVDSDEPPTLPAKRVRKGFTCGICFEDDPDLLTAGLACGHRYCTTCYDQYLKQKIWDEGESRRIRCPAEKCNMIVDQKMVGQIVDASTKERYWTLLNKTFVDDNDAFRWCPSPGCEYAIECHIPHTSLSSTVPTVQCNCGHRFCFACGLPDHQPAICIIVKNWIQKCKEDSETASWISKHTKDCPKCQSPIEKNGGCNHMTCKKCLYEFCWVCMGSWANHRSSYYACNRFDESDSSNNKRNQANSRATLERYLHYYNRFVNHEQSAKLDQQLYERAEKKMEDIQQTSELSWIEVQFLKKAVDVTVQCRTTLQWSYAFAYYLQRDHQTEIFEDNQRDLEMATEHLSELLDKPIEATNIAEHRQNILDKSIYVKQRRDVLLDDTLKGLQEGRWKFHYI